MLREPFETKSAFTSTTGVFLQGGSPTMKQMNVIIDGVSQAGIGTVLIQILEPAGVQWLTPTTPNYTFSVTAATCFLVQIFGPFVNNGVRLNCSVFTSGFIRASMYYV